jgi:hypothetical protein
MSHGLKAQSARDRRCRWEVAVRPPSERPEHARSGEQGWAHEDFGAVGAVGVPSAGGVAVDAVAVVDLGVVAFAEQPGVGDALLICPLCRAV